MSEEDYYPPDAATRVTLSRSLSAGLASLAIGCTLLVSACVLMVFNVILFSRGLTDIPRDLAQVGGGIGVSGVAALGVLAVVLGIRGWAGARKGEPRALGVGATATSIVGLVGWLIAGIDLMMILLD